MYLMITLGTTTRFGVPDVECFADVVAVATFQIWTLINISHASSDESSDECNQRDDNSGHLIRFSQVSNFCRVLVVGLRQTPGNGCCRSFAQAGLGLRRL